MSTKHIRSTADLVRFGASLKIECGSCGAAGTRTGPEIVRTCGAVSLGAVAARLRCARCGEKSARVAIQPPLKAQRSLSHIHCPPVSLVPFIGCLWTKSDYSKKPRIAAARRLPISASRKPFYCSGSLRRSKNWTHRSVVSDRGAVTLEGAVSLGAVAARMRCSRCGEKVARLAVLPPPV